MVAFTRKMYYSIGTDMGPLYTLPGNTGSATAGVMTLDKLADDRIGVGDEVRVGASARRYYIAERISSTQFRLQDSAAGGGTVSFGSSTLEIYRAFNSVTAAVAGSQDINHLGTPDLVTNNFQLNWTCYNDGAINDTATIDGYTTGADTYIHLYAPSATNEVGTSQRHNGVAGSGCRIAPVIDSPGADLNILTLSDEHLRFTGIEVDGSGITNAFGIDGFQIDAVTTDVRFESVIVHDLHGGDAGGGDVHGFKLEGGNVKMSNTLIYDLSESFVDDADTFGVTLEDAGSTVYPPQQHDLQHQHQQHRQRQHWLGPRPRVPCNRRHRHRKEQPRAQHERGRWRQ